MSLKHPSQWILCAAVGVRELTKVFIIGAAAVRLADPLAAAEQAWWPARPVPAPTGSSVDPCNDDCRNLLTLV